MYNKTSVDILIADIYNDIYNETEIDALFSNVDLSSYYINTQIDTLFSNIDLSNYYTKSEVDDISNELPMLILNICIKAEFDNLLYARYPSLSFIVDSFY